MLHEKGVGAVDTEVRIAKYLVHASHQKISSYLKALNDNRDHDLCALADSVIGAGGYTWDVV